MPFESARGTFHRKAYPVRVPRDGRKLPPKWEPANPDEYPNDTPPGQVRGDLLDRALRRASEQETFLPPTDSASRRTSTGGPRDAESVGGRNVSDRKSTRLNSSHSQISYAVFCLKKKITSSKPLLLCIIH